MPDRESSAGKSKAPRPRKAPAGGAAASAAPAMQSPAHARPSALLDTRVIYCGDCLDHPSEPRPSGSGPQPDPAACVDHAYVWPRLPAGEPNSNRNDEVCWGDFSEPRPSGSSPLLAFEHRHAWTPVYIDYLRPRFVELAGVLKKTGRGRVRCADHDSAPS